VTRRVRVEGVRKRTISDEEYGLVLWLQAKRILTERRDQEAKAKARRQRITRKREVDHER
jgi:hypothetical protein